MKVALRLSITFAAVLIADLAWAGGLDPLFDLSRSGPAAAAKDAAAPAAPTRAPLRIELYDPIEEQLAGMEASPSPSPAVTAPDFGPDRPTAALRAEVGNSGLAPAGRYHRV